MKHSILPCCLVFLAALSLFFARFDRNPYNIESTVGFASDSADETEDPDLSTEFLAWNDPSCPNTFGPVHFFLSVPDETDQKRESRISSIPSYLNDLTGLTRRRNPVSYASETDTEHSCHSAI
ncbi:MAG: hypothetical protein MI807_10105 [Verrucomicrobiales bacterium]|nr:hypothetical protein [Verrucomicrobiales bacterium]